MPTTPKKTTEPARPAQGTQAEQEYAMLLEKLAEAAAIVETWTPGSRRPDADEAPAK